MSINEVWQVQLDKWNYQSEYLAKIREFEAKTGRELDAIIAPITPTAAIRHNQFKYYGYASAINVLDFTSVVVPVTFADKGVDKVNEGFAPIGEMDKVVQGECKFISFFSTFHESIVSCEANDGIDDPQAYHGAPVAVQIIGRRLTEERVMAIAEEVGRLLGNEVTP
jgi:amidase